MNKAIQLLSIIALFGIIGFFYQQSTKVEASVPIGNEYQSTMATSTMASASAGNRIFTGSGTLGSLIITSPASAGGNLVVWDATSTATTTYATYDNTNTTKTYGRKVAEIATATIAGTYTFDVALFKGLVIEIPSSWNGIYTISYR